MPQINFNCGTIRLEREAIRLLNLRARAQHDGDLDLSYNEFMLPPGDFIRTYLGGDNGAILAYREYRRDINKLLAEAQDIGGRPPRYMPEWRNNDPLALTKHNRRLLAEFGMREAMKRVYEIHNGETRVHQETTDLDRETWQRRWAFDYGAVLPDWLSRQGLASAGWVPTPPAVPPAVLPPTGPTGSPTGEH